jgi:preprotein translocase subunit SecD
MQSTPGGHPPENQAMPVPNRHRRIRVVRSQRAPGTLLLVALAALVLVAASCGGGAGRTFAFTLTYRVQSAGGIDPTDADVQTVAITMGARLNQTGLADYRVRTPGSTVIIVEASPASAIDAVRAMAATPGHLALVPFGRAAAKPKDSMDLTANPPLIRERDITHGSTGKDSAGAPLVTLQLTQPAALTLYTWTAAHVGDTLAVVMDGVVVVAAPVTGPVDGGLVTVGGLDASASSAFAALVNGGPLAFPVAEVPAGAASPTP